MFPHSSNGARKKMHMLSEGFRVARKMFLFTARKPIVDNGILRKTDLQS